MIVPNLLLAVSLALALPSAVPQPIAQAERVHVSTLRGSGAWAEFQYTQGNLFTFITLQATLDRTFDAPPSSQTTNPVMGITIDIFDLSTGDPLISAFGITSAFDFSLRGDLGTAHLRANVPMDETASGTTFLATVDLTWTATGPLERTTFTERFNRSGLVYLYESFGWQRSARASGSLTCGSSPNCPPEVIGKQLTPFPSTNAVINRDISGTVTVRTRR